MDVVVDVLGVRQQVQGKSQELGGWLECRWCHSGSMCNTTDVPRRNAQAAGVAASL